MTLYVRDNYIGDSTGYTDVIVKLSLLFFVSGAADNHNNCHRGSTGDCRRVRGDLRRLLLFCPPPSGSVWAADLPTSRITATASNS